MSGVYLFVFVSLVISVMSIYTEIVSARFAQTSLGQAAIAETMMLWHGAEYAFAKNSVIPTDSFLSGCSLSPTFDVGNECTDGGTIYQLPDYTLAPLAVYGSRNYLPVGYNYAIQWYTMFFTNAGYKYILTFMDPSAANNSRRFGYSVEDVFSQLQNASVPKISYGRIDTGTCLGGAGVEHHLVTNEFLNGVQVCYPVPLTVNDGSIGIISNIS
ncbi:MAG: hypothetical protein PHW63_07165 [Alphaproteobacteria bacterium]|nr:hypothetical protein [Alphaproteobacteria bacterium]